MFSLISLKNKYSGSISSNVALALFIASLGVSTAFAAMMYFDKKSDTKESIALSAAPQENIILENTSTDSTLSAINNLTSQLMTERQLTNELHEQNENLKQQLQNTAKVDNNFLAYKATYDYLAALEVLKDKPVTTTTSKKIEKTDYYNKVSLNPSSENLLQEKINKFIDKKSDKKSVYFETLKEESKVRSNEVRSIVLKKGESIWMLAKRAYGSGFKYHKIMRANPQITEKNAKYLKVGTIIRVPL